jgi:plasmid stabilization system protein ParE
MTCGPDSASRTTKGRAVIAFTVDDEAARVSILGVFYGGRDYESALGGPVRDVDQTDQ